MASARVLDACAAVGVRLLASAVVWSSGFRAVSDDDYARVVIAQQFAHTPSLDPSGTSWLPLPFWLQGTAMLVFGSELRTAQLVALVTAVASTLLVLQAAHWLDFTRPQSLVAACAASVFPYAARLGVATVPEQLTSALLVLGAASLYRREPARRAWGALAFLAATLSRYEAWPLAVSFLLISAWDAWRPVTARALPIEADKSSGVAASGQRGSRRASESRRWLAFAALPAAMGILGWLLHGLLRHGDAMFFVQRVANYQRALGREGVAMLEGVTRYPRLVFAHEPELMLLAVLSALILWRHGRARLATLARPLTLAALLLLFLIASDLRSAGATHHPERALMPVWTTAALVIGASVEHAWQRLRAFPRAWQPIVVAGLAGTLTLVSVLRPSLVKRDGFVNRSAELALGREAQRVAAEGRLLILTHDYGFFAIIAGFGVPERAATLDRHDPREQRQSDPFSNPEAFGKRLKQQNVKALIVPRSRQAQAEKLGTHRSSVGQYALLAINSSRAWVQ